MMREYKRYDEYKDSGIDWIGEIPKDWEISRIKNFAEAQGGYPFDSNLFFLNDKKGFPLLRIRNILDQKINTYYSGQIVKEALIDNGEILIGMDGDFNVCWWDNGRALMNQRVCKINIKSDLLKKFVYYMIKFPIKKINDITYYTTVKHLSLSQVNNISFALPSEKEQQKIASFLDKKTAEIDEIINKKEKLIDHLENHKKSVITEAVTKGKLGDKYINEDGKLVDEIEMKDSGVEWIGEIPEYWDVNKIKHLLMDGNEGIRIGPFGSSLKLEIMDPNFPYKVYGQKHIISDDFKIGSRYINESKYKEMRKYEIIPGDILVTMMGTIGKCKVIQKDIEKGIIDSHLIRIRVDFNKILPEFLELTIEKNYYTYEAMKYLSNGTVMSGLNSTIVKDLTVVLPSIKIQNKIINYLDKKTNQIDNLIQKTKKSIEKYKEYKKSLIFEAVTGKIDLRDYELKGGKDVAEYNNAREIERKEFSEVN